MPASASSSGDAGLAAKNSDSLAPPGSRAVPDQVSTRPEPSANSTTREMVLPSTKDGGVDDLHDDLIVVVHGRFPFLSLTPGPPPFSHQR